jgi:hypothetical protein
MPDQRTARPLFRKIAIVMAFVCFALAGVLGVFMGDGKLIGAGSCLFVGFVMLTIATKGHWPPRS